MILIHQHLFCCSTASCNLLHSVCNLSTMASCPASRFVRLLSFSSLWADFILTAVTFFNVSTDSSKLSLIFLNFFSSSSCASNVVISADTVLMWNTFFVKFWACRIGHRVHGHGRHGRLKNIFCAGAFSTSTINKFFRRTLTRLNKKGLTKQLTDWVVGFVFQQPGVLALQPGIFFCRDWHQQ